MAPETRSASGRLHRSLARGRLPLPSSQREASQRGSGALGYAKTEQTHGFRRAFKTIAVGNGAPEVWIERMIHNASGGVSEGYLADDWGAMCRAIECIPIHAPAVVVSLDDVRARHEQLAASAV